jgi:hypothetical protein
MKIALARMLCGVLLSGAAVSAQTLPPRAPRESARPIIDNDRVTVWDFTFFPGRPSPLEQNRDDFLSVYLAAGPVRITDAKDKTVVVQHDIGDIIFDPRGTIRSEVGDLADSPARAIVIDLKDHPVPPLANTSGYPNAFPRPRIEKVLENSRIIVWDYTWEPGVATPMHFHDKDVVVVFMENGELKSTTPDGKSVVNKISFGLTKFNARNRVHTETLVDGEGRAVIVELK